MSGFIDKLYLLILSLLILSISCSGGSKLPSHSYIINSTQSYRSGDLIDNFPASELYFKLDSPTKCITVKVVPEQGNDVSREPSASKIFFIVERELDISLFPGNNEFTFVELGRNFDNNWEHSPSVRICTITINPIHKIEPGILYRIRFTNFDRRDARIKVSISGNSKITFLRQ